MEELKVAYNTTQFIVVKLNDEQYGIDIKYIDNIIKSDVFIGPNDMSLAKRLIKAGPEHCKFLRQIQVWADFDMPLYWWSEFDTYKFKISK